MCATQVRLETPTVRHLDEDSIKAAQPGDIIRDANIKGLYLKANAKGKSFMLYYRTKAGTERRPKLGDVGSMTLSTARDVAAKMLAKVTLGGDPSKDRTAGKDAPTMEKLWAKFWKRHSSKKKSSEEDERLWKKNLTPVHKIKVIDLDYETVADLHDDITEDKGPITANRSIALLSTMLNFAVAPLEWIDKNPCKGVKRNKETKRRRYMTPDEAVAVARELTKKSAVSPAGVAFIYLLIFTGARRGEIAKAQWSQVQGNKIVLTEHKTDDSGNDRIIFLPPAAMAVLATLPKTTGTLTGILSPTTLWESVREDAGCPDLRIHDLRHSFASVAISAGMTLAQIGELLGHADSQSSKRYSHLMEDAGHLAAASIGGRIMASLGMQNPPADAEGSPSSATVVGEGSL